MTIPKINSAHGSDTRNILNRAIDSINVQGKSIQDLVAKGQLTPEQYTQLVKSVNGLISKGEITKHDFNTKLDSALLDLSVFDEKTRAAIQGLNPAEVNAVLGFGNVKQENIAEKAVSISKFEDVIKSKNLFDKSDVVSGMVNTSTGKIDLNENYLSTKFSIVNGNTQYTLSRGYYVAFYDSSKKFISGIFGADEYSYNFTTPSDTFFIRFSIHKDLADLDTFMFVKDSTLGDYQPFFEYLPNESVESVPQIINDLKFKADYPIALNKVRDVYFKENPSKWNAQLSSHVSNSSGINTFLPTAKFGNYYQTIYSTIDHVYYIHTVLSTLAIDARVQLAYDSSGAVLGQKSYTGAGVEQKISFTAKKNSAGGIRIKIISYDDDNFKNISFSKPVLVDLTTLYGKGNEPTTEEFESLLKESNGNNIFFENEIAIKEFVKNTKPRTIKPIYINQQNDNIAVRNKYDSQKDVEITWGKTGANGLLGFKSLRYVENTSDIISKNDPTAYNFSPTTDFFSPHKIKAVNNIDGDSLTVDHFTGGNHAYDGGASGSKTARNLNLRLFVDGREVFDYKGYASMVEIVWKNRIQAMNTKKSDGTGREVLEESYRMFFDGVQYSIEGSFELLEDIEWDTFYGLQAYHSNVWDDTVYFHSSPNRKKNVASSNADSLNKLCNKISLSKNGDHLDVAINNGIGIGNREFLSNETRGAFNIGASKKAYFWLVDGVQLSKGDVLTFEGFYRFYSS